jgi:hypothetical protein
MCPGGKRGLPNGRNRGIFSCLLFSYLLRSCLILPTLFFKPVTKFTTACLETVRAEIKNNNNNNIINKNNSVSYFYFIKRSSFYTRYRDKSTEIKVPVHFFLLFLIYYQSPSRICLYVTHIHFFPNDSTKSFATTPGK